MTGLALTLTHVANARWFRAILRRSGACNPVAGDGS
jgi:hypothetical protein